MRVIAIEEHWTTEDIDRALHIYVATSGMLTPRLLRHALDFTSVDRILLSGDYPFHRLDAATLAEFPRTLPDREDRRKIAGANAESLYGLAAGDQTTQPLVETS